ncbi:MAG TPA: aspartate--tRNA ligase [Bacilli bacterium]|jgi:aspartyl-tRNA synthetase|nr:aspartate--tRNA ligase [Bacilli bacterium]
MYRTRYNGTLTILDLGLEVELVGWVAKKRNLGSLLFIDLRDRTGLVQVTLKSDEIEVPEIRNEYVIKVKGVVAKKDVANKNLKTGEIEVLATSIELINKAKNPPIIIADATDALEDTRLKYRYLDLRRSVMQDKLMIRAKIARAAREFLDQNDFIEIETPILTKSTPGGARDYLVPSRLHPGSFYALPQSPQIYKQLLMIGGLERYYQIARCFRDEDLRADRQPDFTQIDIETSFLNYEDFLSQMEKLIHKMFKDVVNYDLKLPLNRLTYHEAMETYGSDKPDTRFDMKIQSLDFLHPSVELFATTPVVRAIVVPSVGDKMSRKQLDELNLEAKKFGINSLANLKLTSEGFAGSLAGKLSEEQKDKILKQLDLKVNDLVIIAFNETSQRVLPLLGALRTSLAKRFNLIDNDKFAVLWVEKFPLFSYDKDNNRYVSEHHPFTMPLVEHLALLETDPSKVLSQAYDIVINGYEAGGGSMRIYNQELQHKIFALLGMTEEEIKAKFGFFIEALEYGTPPHGGIAFGLDRLTMILSGTDNIRDVIAFPKNLSGISLMSEEPNTVSQQQLDELHIKIIKGEQDE